jgi:hypothetical protein
LLFLAKLLYQIRGHHDFICAKDMIRYLCLQRDSASGSFPVW